ncbi:MAG: AAA family ATPase, partial [Verrucomicrobiota bacterium]
LLDAPTLTALGLDTEPLATPDDDASLWDRYFPNDVPFFKMGLLDHLLRRPYHAVKLMGPLKIKQLAEDNRDRTYRSEKVVDQSGNEKTFRLLLRFDGGAFGYLEGDDTFKIYAPTPELAQAIAKQFRRYVKPQAANKPFHYVISIENGGANAQKIYINRPLPVTTEELALHYGDDFPAWEKEWRDRLYRATSGLTIFHGEPGCGKTYFLRALSARLIDLAVFYVIPLSEVELLANPSFVSFWIEQTKRHQKKLKIVILEDAEELLLPREAGSRDKVSNLLNIADGFLGDFLKIHVVATTNAPVRKLDKAVLRPGRLIGQREFRRLTRAEAERLAQAKGLTLADQPDFSLAEIFNGESVAPTFDSERQIGFA